VFTEFLIPDMKGMIQMANRKYIIERLNEFFSDKGNKLFAAPHWRWKRALNDYMHSFYMNYFINGGCEGNLTPDTKGGKSGDE